MNFVTSEKEIQQLGKQLLRVGSLMQSYGTCTARIRLTIDQIATKFGVHADVFITHRALTLTVSDQRNEPLFSGLKRTPPLAINFKIISGISRMSHHIIEQDWSLLEMRKELDRLENLKPYKRGLVLIVVGCAIASFCKLTDGGSIAMAVSFVAAVLGLFVRQEAHKAHYNPYISVFVASLLSTTVVGISQLIFTSSDLSPAFATCVLYLIPGVPLINSFTDFFDGNILNGTVRAINGLIIAFMIALGIISSLLLLKLI